MFVSTRGGATAACGAGNESLFEQIRLDDVLERLGIFGEGCRDRADSGGAAAVLLDDRAQKGTIEAIESQRVDALAPQRLIGDLQRNASVGTNLGEVADAPQ